MNTKHHAIIIKEDLRNLLCMCGLLLGAMALRYAVFLPRFL